MYRSMRIWAFILLLGSFVTSITANCPVGDLNWDCKVNLEDVRILTDRWLDPNCLAPGCEADIDANSGVNMSELSLLAGGWQEDGGPVVHIKWFGHASFKIWDANTIIYIDPWKLKEPAQDANIVLVSHTHSDHYSSADIAKIWRPQTQLLAPPDVIAGAGKGQAIAPGQTIQAGSVRITGVASYNLTKPNHPKSKNWVGFIIEMDSMRIYYAGDTDLTDEMKALTNIEVAMLPVGGIYTMNADEAAEATGFIMPRLAIPCHWGDIVGTLADAERFASLAHCYVKILAVNETISSADWLEDLALIAHWKLDEAGGNLAYDYAGGNTGTLYGGPVWQPTGGQVDGTLEFDGSNDYVSTPFVLNPAAGAFSVFAWVKTDTPARVIISQRNGTGFGRSWLCTTSPDGKLMTDLRLPGRFGFPLMSQTVVADGDWHHTGFVWNGALRHLYVDYEKVAVDTNAQAGLESSDGGLYFGVGNTLDATTFWPGLIDDVRIYNRAVSP
ncbi:MAG: MBL fold metallo-hydrolase [Planctomycetota bacterium]|nr:MBL fold metallo-hydrolase [Planctomycetota bacterium]